MNNANVWALTNSALDDAIRAADIIVGSPEQCFYFAQTEMGEAIEAAGVSYDGGPLTAIAILSGVLDRQVEASGEWNRTNPERHGKMPPNVTSDEFDDILNSLAYAVPLPEEFEWDSKTKKEIAQAWMMLTLALREAGVNPLEELEKWANEKKRKRERGRG